MALMQHNADGGVARERAFTVVELLVAVSIMTLIVVVLYGMFDQTQRALRGNSAQTDVTEGGRAGMGLIARELELMGASRVTGCTNFWVEVTSPPWKLQLVSSNAFRTNVLQEVFFISQFNKSWSGIGFKILATNGVGSLYRFGVTVPISRFNPSVLSSNWTVLANTNYPDFFQRVTDGIVHFRVTAFDGGGYLYSYTNIYNNTNITVQNAPFNGLPTGENRYVFRRDAVPAAVEVELGVLEPQVFERFKSFPNPIMASNYLARQAGAVHLFQKRIPVRTAQ